MFLLIKTQTGKIILECFETDTQILDYLNYVDERKVKAFKILPDNAKDKDFEI